MFKHILIPTDGSPVANRAAKAGIALARRLGAKVTAYCAIEGLAKAALPDGSWAASRRKCWRTPRFRWWCTTERRLAKMQEPQQRDARLFSFNPLQGTSPCKPNFSR
jgi:nucleotide-binding universal stress UspA family protein